MSITAKSTGILVVGILLGGIVISGKSTDVSAQGAPFPSSLPGQRMPNDGQRLVVSAPPSQFAQSFANVRLYVPTGQGATVTLHTTSSDLTLLGLSPTTGTNTCDNSVQKTTAANNGATVDNLTVPFNWTTIPTAYHVRGYIGADYVDYAVYCVFVNTVSSNSSPFYLTSDGNSVLGTQLTQLSGTPFVKDDTPNSGGAMWDKEISVATPCSVAATGNVQGIIYLYDLDVNRSWANGSQGPVGVTLTKQTLPTAQSPTGGPPINVPFEVHDSLAFSNNVFSNGRISTSGEHKDFFLRISGTIDPATKYTLRLTGLNDINAIKIGLPVDQIYASFACSAAPTCTFNNMPSLMSTGATADIDVTVTNNNDLPLTFNPADTSSSLTLIDPSNLHARSGQYAAPGTSANTNATPDNTTRWRGLSPPDGSTVMSTFVDSLDGRTKERIHPSAVRTIQKGQSITFRVRIRASDLATGNLAENAAGYDIGFRVLQRQYRPMWDAFLPYSPSCGARIPIITTPQAISANCAVSPSSLEPGGSYSPFIRFTHSTPAGGDATGRVVVSLLDQNGVAVAGSGRQNLNFVIARPVSPATSRDSSVGVAGATYAFAAPNTAITLPTAGTYTAVYDWSWTAGAQSGPATPVAPATTNDCVTTIRVASRPYFKVLGDIVTHDISSSIVGWNQALGNTALGYEATFPVNNFGNFGAGAQGAILSAGPTSGVSSKFRNNGNSPKALTLSNVSPPGDLIWGGQFGVPFLMPQPELTNLRPSATVNAVGGIATGAYTLSGNTLSGGSIPAGRQVTIYAEGDVRIVPGAANGIVYGNAAGYATRNDIPRFRLIATGNIFVDPAVTQLDGEYVAGNGGVGSVYTCFAAGWSVPIDGVVNNPYGVCASTLLVNGSLTGDSIKLTRAVGTLRNAASNDADLIGVNSYRNSGNVAEIIQYTPELFLVNPVSSGANSNYGYDSITALPPLF